MDDDNNEVLEENQTLGKVVILGSTFEKTGGKATTSAIVKEKKPRSQKQIEQFERIKSIRDANRKARAEQKAIEEEQQKKEMEDKIVKKAISIKKKQILKQKVLDEISDEETPVEEVKAKIIKSTFEKTGGKEPIGTKVPVKPPLDNPTASGIASKHQMKEPTITNNSKFFFC